MHKDKNKYQEDAAALKTLREAAELSISQIAAKLRVTPQRYRQWETIFGPLPQRKYSAALARIFDRPVPFESGVEPEEEPAPDPDDHLDYEALGMRAEARMGELGLKSPFVAESIGIDCGTLRKWHKKLPRKRSEGIDETWEDLLLVPRGWLRTPDMETPEIHPPVLDLTAHAWASVTQEIEAVGNWLTRKQPTLRQADSAKLTESEKRRSAMFADRYGVSGPETTTLQLVGDKYGLTRERVRQITEGMVERARTASFVLPRLNQLKEIVASHAALSITAFEEKYREILGGNLSLADADLFAREVLGSSVADLGERTYWPAGNALQPMILESRAREIAVAVRDAARRMIRSCGAAQLMYVTGMVSEATGKAISIRDVRNALIAVEGMEWLSEDEGWFWFGVETADNRLLDVVRRVLAVANGRVDVEDLHQAMSRSRRAHRRTAIGAVPALELPTHVMRDMLSRVPWLTIVQMDDFMLREPVPAEEVLSDSEMAVIELINATGGAVARAALNKHLVDTGRFSVPALQVVLAQPPVIQPLGFGAYGKRGIHPPHEAIERAWRISRRGGMPAMQDEDGWLEFDLEVTQYKLVNRVVDFPTNVIKIIPVGKYQVGGEINGTMEIGTNPSAPNRVLKLGRLMNEAGIQPGEILQVRIHPEDMLVRVSRVTAENENSP